MFSVLFTSVAAYVRSASSWVSVFFLRPIRLLLKASSDLYEVGRTHLRVSAHVCTCHECIHSSLCG